MHEKTNHIAHKIGSVRPLLPTTTFELQILQSWSDVSSPIGSEVWAKCTWIAHTIYNSTMKQYHVRWTQKSVYLAAYAKYAAMPMPTKS